MDRNDEYRVLVAELALVSRYLYSDADALYALEAGEQGDDLGTVAERLEVYAGQVERLSSAIIATRDEEKLRRQAEGGAR